MAEGDESELEELREQAMTLEEEVAFLRRKLQDAPKRVRTLEERLLETKGQLAQTISQNEKLTYTLREARDEAGTETAPVEGLLKPSETTKSSLYLLLANRASLSVSSFKRADQRLPDVKESRANASSSLAVGIDVDLDFASMAAVAASRSAAATAAASRASSAASRHSSTASSSSAVRSAAPSAAASVSLAARPRCGRPCGSRISGGRATRS